MHKNKIALAVAFATLSFAGLASAAGGTATADNAFAVYTGNATGSNLQLVGSGANWIQPFTFGPFNVAAGDYLYVAVANWGDSRGFLGTFTTPIGVINSNTTDWLGANTPINYAPIPDLPLNPLTASTIQGITWGPTYLSTGSWTTDVANPNAKWIWSGDSDNILLRTATTVAAIPEPETHAMLLAGVGLIGAVLKRRKAKLA